MVRVHVSSDLCILIKCLREVLRLLVPGSPVQYRDRRLHPNKRRWSSPPASLPFSGGTSHSWSTPQNSAGSLRCQNSMTWPSSICFGSGPATITLWISQTPRDWVGEKASTGVWEVSGPESKPALCCLRWPRHGGRPSSMIRHGLLSPRIHHGRPSSMIRNGLLSPPLRHGSQNGHRPGGLLSCPVSVSLEASRAPTPPRNYITVYFSLLFILVSTFSSIF